MVATIAPQAATYDVPELRSWRRVRAMIPAPPQAPHRHCNLIVVICARSVHRLRRIRQGGMAACVTYPQGGESIQIPGRARTAAAQLRTWNAAYLPVEDAAI